VRVCVRVCVRMCVCVFILASDRVRVRVSECECVWERETERRLLRARSHTREKKREKAQKAMRVCVFVSEFCTCLTVRAWYICAKDRIQLSKRLWTYHASDKRESERQRANHAYVRVYE